MAMVNKLCKPISSCRLHRARASIFASPASCRPAGPSRSPVLVQASGEGGVQDLLSRDRKKPQVQPELDTVDVESVLVKRETADEPVRSKKQRQERMAKAAEAGAAQDPNRPKRCKEAIDKGLSLFQQKQYQAAIEMFQLALELPGNGAYRLAGSPREYSCPSDAEENACLYNMACAYAQLGQKSSAITCLEGALENGFEDYNTIRTDPDLAPVRGTELDILLFKYDNPAAKVAKAFKKPDVKVSDTNKPWFLW